MPPAAATLFIILLKLPPSKQARKHYKLWFSAIMQTAKTKTKQNKSSIISEFHIRLLFPIMNITRVEKSRSINQPPTCTLGTYHQVTAQRRRGTEARGYQYDNCKFRDVLGFFEFFWSSIWLRYKIRDPFCLYYKSFCTSNFQKAALEKAWVQYHLIETPYQRCLLPFYRLTFLCISIIDFLCITKRVLTRSVS